MNAEGFGMVWDWSLFAIAAPAVIFAGISKGGFGSGAAFAAASILALILTPGQALGLMLPLLILVDVVTLRPYWRKWHWSTARLMILGGVPGVCIGAAIYSWTNDDVIRFGIGAMSLIFVAWQLASKAKMVPVAKSELPDWVGVLAGTISGFTSFISHAGGPPAAIYMLSLRLSKTQYQSNTVITFFIVNSLKAVAYSFLGIFTLELLSFSAALAPFALLGAWIGVKAHYLVPEQAFFALTYALLTLTGTKLIYDAFV